jgi:two-component system, NarL family, response regulator
MTLREHGGAAWPALRWRTSGESAAGKVLPVETGAPPSTEVLPPASIFDCLTSMRIRILLIDDHPAIRTGLRTILSVESDFDVVAEGKAGAEAVLLHAEHSPDVTLMDLRMPGMGGIAAIRAIRAASPAARILAVTTYDGDTDIHRALDVGACGYLIKDTPSEDILDAVRSAASGRRVIPTSVAARLAEFTPRIDLTEREIEVLRLAAKGLRNAEIARVIGRAEGTVKAHLRTVHQKLGVEDRTEAVTLALQRGIIHLDD